MWPWEHAIYGYFLYSVGSRIYSKTSPNSPEAVIVVLASLLPDMIDKPLAWNVGVISTGYGPGHSVLFVLPLLVLVCLLARYFGRLRIGVAFSIGYLAHLPGDIVFAYTGDRILQPGIVLWPVRTYSSADGTGGVLGETFRRVTEFSTELTSGNPSLYVKSQLIVATLTFALWVADGSPPLGNGTKIVCRRFREYLGRSES